MNASATIESRGRLAPSERTIARRLGLGLAIAVAFGCDVVAVALRGETDVHQNGWPFLAFDLTVGLLPIVAAAPFGWLFGPRLIRARLPGKFGVAVTMALSTMLLGDLVYVLGSATLSSIFSEHSTVALDLPGLLALAAVGAVFVGPFVVALATLPAAVVWVCAFRLIWRSMSDPARSR